MPLLSASQLSVFYADVHIFSNVSLEVGDRAHVGIVGPNGGGKTSLLRVLVGEQAPKAGTVHRSRGLRVGYVPQMPVISETGTLRDVVMAAFDELLQLEAEVQQAAQAMEHATGDEQRRTQSRYADLVHKFEAQGGYEYHITMDRVAAGLGLSQETLDTPVSSASGGQRTRAALARALLSNPDILVMDEPTNHLDLSGLDWLENFLAKYPHAFVVVSHDRYFLDRVVDQVWELERGQLQSFPGNYTKYLVLKEEQITRQQKEYEAQQAYIAKEESFIRRYGAGQRSQEAQGRATRLARLQRLEAVQQESTAVLSGVSASRAGQVVLRTKGLKVGYVEDGKAVELLSMPDIALERGMRVAMIGANGAGKTTFLRTILGESQPLSGTVTLGHNVKAGYYRQGQDDLPDDLSILDAFLQAKEMPLQAARSFLARFLFRGDDVFQRVGSHSGGERSRLALARLLVTQPNLLVLDEPTNHLDIPSREALEQVLQSYDGTLILVSHDRRIVSLLAEQVWTVADRQLRIFDGTFDEWIQHNREEAAKKAEAKAAERPARQSAQRPKPAKKVAPKEDPEQVIAALEARLADLEHRLAEASAAQALETVARLGKEHSEVQAEMDAKWAAWAE